MNIYDVFRLINIRNYRNMSHYELLRFFFSKKKIKAKSKLQISSIQIELPFQLRCKTTELVQNWNRGRETWPTMKNVDSQILVEGANHGAEKADGSASPADAGEDAGGGLIPFITTVTPAVCYSTVLVGLSRSAASRRRHNGLKETTVASLRRPHQSASPPQPPQAHYPLLVLLSSSSQRRRRPGRHHRLSFTCVDRPKSTGSNLVWVAYRLDSTYCGRHHSYTTRGIGFEPIIMDVASQSRVSTRSAVHSTQFRTIQLESTR